MDAYEFNSMQYPKSRVINPGPRLLRALEMIGTGKKVLDIGCFDGVIGKAIKDKGNVVFGIDASAPAVEKAVAAGVNATVGNLEQRIPFDDASFDVVFAGEIIEHVFEIDLLMQEIRRILRPDGFAVFTTPNLAALGRRLMLLVGMNPHIEISFRDCGAAGHIRYFIRDTMNALLKKHGFCAEQLVSDVVNFNSTGSLSSQLLARIFPSIGSTIIVKASLIRK